VQEVLTNPHARVMGRGPHLVVLEASAAFVVATIGHYVVILVKKNLGASGLSAFERASTAVLREHSRVAHLVVLLSEHEVPGPVEREGISRVLRQFRGSIAAAAIVFEGGGLRATLIRSAVSAIGLIGRASHPERVFADSGDATVWLGSHAPNAEVDTTTLRSAIRELRAQFR